MTHIYTDWPRTCRDRAVQYVFTCSWCNFKHWFLCLTSNSIKVLTLHCLLWRCWCSCRALNTLTRTFSSQIHSSISVIGVSLCSYSCVRVCLYNICSCCLLWKESILSLSWTVIQTCKQNQDTCKPWYYSLSKLILHVFFIIKLVKKWYKFLQ